MMKEYKHRFQQNLYRFAQERPHLTVGMDENYLSKCIATIATPQVSVNRSEKLTVGDCDHGPIEYTVLSPGKDNNTYTVSLTFHSSVIEDAGPPTCDISWNGTYLVPKSSVRENPDLLPSCFTGDSREGYHLTYYWFHLLDWEFE